MSHQMLERDLDLIEKRFQIDLGRNNPSELDKDDEYYPQFKGDVRRQAAEMARHYEIFYCLEKAIREIIQEKLEAEHGSVWWDQGVPQPVRDNVKKNMLREAESGVTPRSSERIDYTTFGELSDIVRANWGTFSDTFNNEKAFGRIMASLNILRGPIAHCSPLAPDEVVRLGLAVSDWFRLMA